MQLGVRASTEKRRKFIGEDEQVHRRRGMCSSEGMNTFIGSAKGEELTGVATATRGKEARGAPELSAFGGGARISGRRRRECSGVVQ